MPSKLNSRTDVERQIFQVLQKPHNQKETFIDVARLTHRVFVAFIGNPDPIKDGTVTKVECEVLDTTQDTLNILNRGIPYEEIKDLCTLALDVCQIIIERQVQDRKTLPEWQDLERKTTERMGEILKDPRYIALYRDFPGGN